MEQLSLINYPQDWMTRVQTVLDSVIEEQSLPTGSLCFRVTHSKEDAKVQKDYYSIVILEPPYPMPSVISESNSTLTSIVRFVLCKQPEIVSIIISKTNFETLGTLPSGFKKVKCNEPGNVKLEIPTNEFIFDSFIKQFVIKAVKDYSSSADSFGCCSLFKECSAEGKCLHSNQLYSKACIYRNSLEQGKVFFKSHQQTVFTANKTENNKAYKNYIVLDVETPNKYNNAVCSIAMLVVRENEPPQMIYSLINPECDFDSYNINFTGITPESVSSAPLFSDFWNLYADLIVNNLIVGHNLSYDFSVIGKTLERYGIEMPIIKYFDTLLLSKSLMDMKSYSLTAISQSINYSYDAHKAYEDVNATNNLFNYLQNNYDISMWNMKSYDFSKCGKSQTHRTSCDYTANLSDDTKALLNLKQLITEISADNIITKDEINTLNNWLRDNESLHVNYPYDKIYATVNSILKDGIMDESEERDLLNTIDEFLNLKTEKDISIKLQDKTFCLTGDFINGTKADIAAMLIALGAIEQKGVTKKTNYLFVGGNGSDRWKFASAGGGKISKAHELNDKGADIHIIHELDLFEQLDS